MSPLSRFICVSCWFLAGLMAFLPVSAQDKKEAFLGTEVTRRKILIGEPFTLILKGSIPLKDFNGQIPPFPDTIPRFDILETAKLDTAQSGGRLTITYTAKMTSFDSGRQVIPSMGFRVGKNILKTDSIGIDVMTVALEGNDYRDIHEIVEVEEPPFNWKPWAAGALGALVLALLTWYYLRNRKKKGPAPSLYDSKLSPYDQAMQGLKSIRESGYMEKGEPVAHYASMYDVFRVYLVRKFNMPVMSDTTGEILARMQEGKLNRDMLGKLAAVLRIADAAKFAKYPSTREEGIESLEALEEIIRNLNQPSS